VFRIRGKGVPHVNGYGRGDQHVMVKVVTPGKLNEKQKELLREFASLSADSPQASGTSDKGFFGKMKDAFIG
jgi:molecular chaperone DnaJ